MAEVTAWQSRPLEPMYPVVFSTRCAQDPRGRRGAQQGDLSGAGHSARRHTRHPRLWIEGTEGAKFWMKVFNDLKTRGVGDILKAAMNQFDILYEDRFIKPSV
ncbi:transposase [Burkholderia pseudomallei]|nr:transposase mutator type [Burkholderia pseudomallei]